MTKKFQLGLWSATAMVIGNMIGSGVFLLPTTLAPYGWISYIAWTCSAVGAILLALVFGNLAKLDPNQTGGPYAYTKSGLGKFPGFLVAWGYWISIWCTNAAIAVALVGYLEVFFPSLGTNKLAAIITGLSFIWVLTFLNTKSLKEILLVQRITTFLKLTPILLLGILGLFYLNFDFESSKIMQDGSLFELITSATTLTFFAFLGMESATIVSSDTKNPEKNVNRATLLGTLITGLAYLLSYLVISQTLDQELLMNSNAPFADTAGVIWGDSARYFIAAAAVIATVGALNGWLLIQSKIPFAAASDELFPKIFSKTNSNNIPLAGILISSALVSLLMLLNYSKTLVQAFSFMMKLSTLSVITPYLFSTSVLVLWTYKRKLKHKKRILVLSAFALLFSLWMVMGSGLEIVLWGIFLLALGLPVYVYLKKN